MGALGDPRNQARGSERSVVGGARAGAGSRPLGQPDADVGMAFVGAGEEGDERAAVPRLDQGRGVALREGALLAEDEARLRRAPFGVACGVRAVAVGR